MAFSDAQIQTMRNKLGVAEDADEATILAAMDEALDERAEPQPQAPDGQTLVSKAELEEMRGDAKRGAAAAKRLHEIERKAAMDKYADRYLPANRSSWEEEYDRNPKATVEALAKRPVVIPLDEIGHQSDEDSTGIPESRQEIHNDPAYKNWRI